MKSKTFLSYNLSVILLFCPSWSCIILCSINRFTSLCKNLFTRVSSRSFPMLCASFSMLDGPSGTGYDEVGVPVHGCWDTRDVSVDTVSLSGLGVTCLPRDPRFAGSNPAEVDGCFQDVKILSTCPLGGTLSWESWVWDFRLVKEPQAWTNSPLSKI